MVPLIITVIRYLLNSMATSILNYGKLSVEIATDIPLGVSLETYSEIP